MAGYDNATVSMRAYFNSFNNSDRLIERNTSSAWSFALTIDSTNLNFYYRDNDNRNAQYAHSSLSTGQWYHLLWTYDSGANPCVVAYIDNSEVADNGAAGDSGGLESGSGKSLFICNGGSG